MPGSGFCTYKHCPKMLPIQGGILACWALDFIYDNPVLNRFRVKKNKSLILDALDPALLLVSR